MTGLPSAGDEPVVLGRPGVITCSALNRAYRDLLRGEHVIFVYLAERIVTALGLHAAGASGGVAIP